ncbi:MAG: hypothetical protein D6722_12555 [Bacteroidetes bacterium]|nr:MAG: hypothetical protein D6722_12555 [Bacteroidota bacterium]
MKDDRYIQAIEEVLRQMAELERHLSEASGEGERQRLTRALRLREKRLERMTPFQFRLQLRNLCLKAGVQGNFL